MGIKWEVGTKRQCDPSDGGNILYVDCIDANI